ncbi:MAG: porin family protein [Bacteroidales bacterium]|jgi:hypothetical protein
MKKIILIIAAVTLMANISSAQDSKTDFRNKLLFGLKIGANYSNVYDTKGEDFVAKGKFGFAGGAFLEIPIGTYLGIQPEFLFSQRGYKATGTVLGLTYQYTSTSNYIDVPILLALKPSEFITILVGPQYSYLIKQEDVFSSSLINSDQEQDFKNNNIRKNTFCFTGGVDITIQHFVIGARVGWDLMTNNGDGTSTNPRYKNEWYQGTVGFRF